MDHIPRPRDPRYPPMPVDYICRPDFRPNAYCFATFPSEWQLEMSDILIGRLSSLLGEYIDIFLQEWLFYVLLSDFLKIGELEYCHEDFVQTDSCRNKVVGTSKLPDYMARWTSQEIRRDSSTKARHAQATQELMDSAKTVMGRNWEPTPDGVTRTPTKVTDLSIMILTEALDKARFEAYDLKHFKPFWMRHQLPRERLLQEGWCRNKVTMLNMTLTNSSMYFVSMLKQPSTTQWTHENCSDDRCSVNTIDRDTYQPRHVHEGCRCNHVGPSPAEIAHSLESGGFPLIKASGCDCGRPLSAEVVHSSLHHSPSYVAISHVWSDGRGNLRANAIPSCQLELIRQIVRAVSGAAEGDDDATLFWMDTLCVPFGHDDTGMRRTAIGRMRHCYKNAAQVLVIDSELASSPSHSAVEESLIRILCSGWMRRLWTLQEGVLADALFFQFADRALSFKALVEASGRSGPQGSSSVLSMDAIKCASQFEDFSIITPDNTLALMMALAYRNTSWKNDEPICLSILLDLDTEKVAEKDDIEERMCVLFSLLNHVPTSLMFIDVPRIEKDTFRWAPKSLMQDVFRSLGPERHAAQAKLTKLGLIVGCPGIFLSPRSIPAQDISFFRLEGDQAIYRLSNSGRKHGGPSWTVRGLHDIEDPAIILEMDMSDSEIEVVRGVLVSVYYESERGELCATFQCSVWVSKETHEFPPEVMEHMLEVESTKPDRTANLGIAEATDDDQVWIVR